MADPASDRPGATLEARVRTADSDRWLSSRFVADERLRGPEDELINTDNLTQVTRLLDEMDPREATILRMRFGLDNAEPQTLKEIGEALGLTRERVRQIESEALRRLYRTLNGD